MGTILYAKCKCGYEKDNIYVGGGMSNFRTYNPFPHYCQDCKIMFEANLYDEQISCTECGSSNIVPYDDPSVCNTDESIPRSRSTKVWVLTDGECLCPNCGEMTLKFETVMNYD